MYHNNGRFYVTTCADCKEELQAKTIREMKTLDDFHECGTPSPKISEMEDYLVEHPTAVEWAKPSLSTKR